MECQDLTFFLTVLIELFPYVVLQDLENPLCYLHFMLIKNDVLQKKASWVHCTYIHTPQTKFTPLKSNPAGL